MDLLEFYVVLVLSTNASMSKFVKKLITRENAAEIKMLLNVHGVTFTLYIACTEARRLRAVGAAPVTIL